MGKCQQGKCPAADRYYPDINMDPQIQIEAGTTIEADIDTEREIYIYSWFAPLNFPDAMSRCCTGCFKAFAAAFCRIKTT